jgi:hypothetical protein
MAVIIKIHARELTGAETIRGGVAELGGGAVGRMQLLLDDADQPFLVVVVVWVSGYSRYCG